MKTLQQLVSERVLLLDGATGTMVQQYGMATGNNDILSLTHPEVVEDIHTRYLRAGADIIETCTFNAQRISLADCGAAHQVRDINLAAATIARRCADAFSTDAKPRFVAGSVGPTNKTLSMSPRVEDPAYRDLTFDELEAAYEEQMEALLEGGVDALLIETIFDTLNAKAAISAALTAMERMQRTVPLMLSVTLSGNSGRTLSGQTLDAFLASVSTYPIFSVGLNCSFGAGQMKPFLRQLAAKAPCYVSCYPNAGLPNALGGYDTTAGEWAATVQGYLDEGLVNIVGGCCGTTDEYIAALAPRVQGAAVRKVSAPSSPLLLSGLEALPAPSFVPVGERCNVAGSRKFLRLISGHSYAEAVAIARGQVDDGALVIDINMDDGLLDTRAEMVHFLNLLAAEPDIARVPFMIDSSDWSVITAALGCIQGKAIVNSISLKEGEAVFLDHARQLRRRGAAVVVMAFDEQGQADTYERRIAVCGRAYRLLVDEVGMNPSDIIFDPNILAVATGMPEHDAYALDFIRATQWIRKNLPGAHVSGGVSNLSFAFRGHNSLREAMHAVFLHHAKASGLDMAIINPHQAVRYADIPADELQAIEDVILYRRPDAASRLMDWASLHAEPKADMGEPKPSTPSGTGDGCPSQHTHSQADVTSRLVHALLHGDGSTLAADLAEALTLWPSAVSIIEGPLMEGMNQVGELFGAGQMFLPQVVKAARTMKEAVGILQPAIDAARPSAVAKAVHPLGCTCAACAGTSVKAAPQRVLLATVKGDVHDIGKNIVAVVMACSGYDIIDMGVMVPAADIVRKAQEVKPAIIGLSGLITPSLAEMVTVAEALQAAGLRIPLLIGGATTSAMHTALKIAPVYDGPVVHVADASQNSRVAASLLNPATSEAFVRDLRVRQEELRQQFASRQHDLLSLEEARLRKPHLFD